MLHFPGWPETWASCHLLLVLGLQTCTSFLLTLTLGRPCVESVCIYTVRMFSDQWSEQNPPMSLWEWIPSVVSCLDALESSKSVKHDLKLELSFEVLLLYCWRYRASSSSLLLIDPGPSFESTIGGRNFYCLVQSEMLNMGKSRLFLGHGLWQHARWGCRRFRVKRETGGAVWAGKQILAGGPQTRAAEMGV